MKNDYFILAFYTFIIKKQFHENKILKKFKNYFTFFLH